MRKLFLFTMLVVALVVLASPVAFAQGTPDGETPANEGVCDVLQGSTPGLYGLCVAYCEAQDCDADMAVANQCDTPNPRILTNYDKKKNPGDPEMPCIKTPCPCWTESELAGAFNDPVDTTCTDCGDEDVSLDMTHGGAAVGIGRSGLQCSLFIMGDPPFSRAFPVTPAEAQACAASLRSLADSLGISCFGLC